MARVLLAGACSGSGKTTLTIGLLQCLLERGIRVQAKKCGPDYIDPMFHSRVLGVKTGNLDPFFLPQGTMNWLLQTEEQAAEFVLLEGVMGYYDGIGMTSDCSTYTVAQQTQTPVVLVLDCKGMGASIGAMLTGFLQYRTPSGIAGVIFNRLPPGLYPKAQEIAKSLQIAPLGYLPQNTMWQLESRHLGLVTAQELPKLQEQLLALSRAVEQTVDVDGILALGRSAKPISGAVPYVSEKSRRPVSIAVAQDEAFCFTYRENLELLEALGCRLLPFSPLRDAKLPEAAQGLLLSGGYPELYARALSENTAMRRSVKAAIADGMPCIAECGGFLYLHTELEDATGERYPMAGVFSGCGVKSDRLGKFGYLHLTARQDNLLCKAGARLTAHEFHYWKAPDDGAAFSAVKASGSGGWACGFASETLYAGFPHFCFYGNPGMAERFVERCVIYGLERSAK